jgi:HSP20 family protein
MYYTTMHAAKGRKYGDRARHLANRSAERAAVNIYKTDNSYEMLVFAPGRIREHFKVETEGNELQVSYRPPEGFPRPDWVRREYSRGGFLRTFHLDEVIDANGITAKYEDGVLHIHLPLVAGKETTRTSIDVS